jgi:DNA-binding MurR/RpiR family transcriptional regulator
MAIKSSDGVLGVVEEHFESLSPQLQLAARYVLSAPDDVAVYSMREIAGRADVKPSTMLRLANKLGFENYNLLRDAFRERISKPANGYAARARSLQLRNQSVDGSLVAEMAEAEQANIVSTFAAITDEDLKLAAEDFLKAEKVFIVGLRKCAPIASFFQYATRVFFNNSRLVTGCAGMFAEEISQIEANDAVFAVAFDPYTRETVEAINQARTVGARIIVVTDNNVSPLTHGATHTFIAANRSPSFYRSLTGALSIVQALVAAIVTALGDGAVQALEKSDENLRAHQTYWKN